MSLNLDLSDVSLILDSGYAGGEVYPFWCSMWGHTQHQFVPLPICNGERMKKCTFASQRSMHIHVLDDSKNTMSILKTEV